MKNHDLGRCSGSVVGSFVGQCALNVGAADFVGEALFHAARLLTTAGETTSTTDVTGVDVRGRHRSQTSNALTDTMNAAPDRGEQRRHDGHGERGDQPGAKHRTQALSKCHLH